jgi:membrane protease YdiL (CAAX protease family)
VARLPAPMPAVRGASPPLPPRPDGPAPFPFADWDLDELLPMLFVPFGIVLLAQYLVVGFLGWTSDGARVLLSAVQQLSLFVPVAVWIRRTRGSLAPLGLRPGWTGRDVLAGVAGGFVAIVAGVVAIGITMAVVEAITGHRPDVSGGLGSVEGPWLYLEALMAVAVAPLCEETFFRGFLFQGLRLRVALLPAALVSGAFFAFVHVEPIRFFGLTAMGAVLAGVFERRRTLVASIAAHATINLIAVIGILATR